EICTQVYQRTAFLQDRKSLAQFLFTASAQDHTVYRASVLIQDTLKIIFFMVIYQMCRSVLLCHLKALLPGTDGKHISRAVKHRRAYCRQSDRPDAQHCHGGTELRIQL